MRVSFIRGGCRGVGLVGGAKGEARFGYLEEKERGMGGEGKKEGKGVKMETFPSFSPLKWHE